MNDMSTGGAGGADRWQGVHDYDYEIVNAANIADTDVLIGESGGLSAIYEIERSALMEGMIVCYTEHGALYLDQDLDYCIIKRI
jgi:hypothetical protein